MFFTRSAIFFRGYLFLLLILGAWHCKGPVRQPAADITYENGTGKARTIRLPDGSSVVMSIHTVIRISRQFNQSGRELDLDGEALFTVDGDGGKAFIVHTRNLQIEVLGAGTRFRVDAFQKNAGEEADLLEGKLKVIKSYHSDTDNEPETITSGEMVMINRDIDLMEKEKLDSTELTTLKARW
jgi:transmembrane sensor